MKTKCKLLVSIFILMLVVCCGKKSGKLEIINNPQSPDLEQVQLDLIKTIDLKDKIEDMASWIVADEKVYFCSILQKSVTILDFDGNVIKKLDSIGKGPGEFLMPQVIINDERNSRIEVFDNMLRRNSYFTYDGEYMEDKMLPTTPMFIPQDRKIFGEYDVEYIFRMNIKPDKIVMSPTIQIVKPDTNIILVTRDVDLNLAQMDVSQFAYAFACSDEYAYVSPITTDRYTIDVFNADGEKVKEIRKQFDKIKKSEEDITKMKEQFAEYERMSKDLGSDMKYDLSEYEYLTAVGYLAIDNKGNLWVGTAYAGGENYFDVINPKGKIIKKCNMDKDFIGIRFYNNKLIEVIKNPDDTYKMNIYEVNL
ncbi:MAG: 6-bladed beta-propeller [Candidatus Cloacimonetes bacterium]|nr:6-bladed beta-propeller [Candidatus Cloacimonadota bacterium]